MALGEVLNTGKMIKVRVRLRSSQILAVIIQCYAMYSVHNICEGVPFIPWPPDAIKEYAFPVHLHLYPGYDHFPSRGFGSPSRYS